MDHTIFTLGSEAAKWEPIVHVQASWLGGDNEIDMTSAGRRPVRAKTRPGRRKLGERHWSISIIGGDDDVYI